MTVRVEFPDNVARQLHLDGTDVSRQALVLFAVDGYRKHKLSRGQVSELLDLSFTETAELLAQQGCGIGSDMTADVLLRQLEQGAGIS